MSVVPREQFEQARDLVNEKQVLADVMACWGCTGSRKLPRAYHLDYLLLCGEELLCFAEIKCRNLAFGFGDGYYISLLKVMKARELTAASAVQSLSVVRFRDGAILWAPLLGRYRVKFFGRNVPRDAEDHEPCAVIPWRYFLPLDAMQEIG